MPNFATQTTSLRSGKKKKEEKKKKNGGPGPKAQIKMLPVAVGTITKSRGPAMQSRNSNVVIANEELILQVPMVAETAFADGLDTVPVQAGSRFCFPWLSSLALNFQSYAFKKLVFHYKPSCPTSTAGIVSLAFDPDPSNPAPSTLGSLSALRERVTGSAWTNLSLAVPPKAMAALGGRKLVRSDSEAISRSSRPQFDCGNLYIYSGSGTALPLCGLLYVSYAVELYVPQPPEGGSAALCTFMNSGTTSVELPFGATPVGVGNLLISTRTYVFGGGVPDTTEFTFGSKGRYLISLFVKTSAAGMTDLSYGWVAPVQVQITSFSGGTNFDADMFTSRVCLTALVDGAHFAFRYQTPATGVVSQAAVTFIFSTDDSSLPL